MSQRKNKRTRSVVESEVQLGLARRILIHWFIFLVVAGCAGIAVHILANPLRPASEQLSSIRLTYLPFLFAMLSLLPLFVYDTIKFSLRFAGPIVRLRQVIHDLAEGKPVQPLETRKGDFWKSTIDEINILVERLNQKSIA